MQTCNHVFAPLDSQNVQCSRCEYVRHRVEADDLEAHPVKQTLTTDDLSEMLKGLPPITTPIVPMEPFTYKADPSMQRTYTDSNTSLGTAIDLTSTIV